MSLRQQVRELAGSHEWIGDNELRLHGGVVFGKNGEVWIVAEVNCQYRTIVTDAFGSWGQQATILLRAGEKIHHASPNFPNNLVLTTYTENVVISEGQHTQGEPHIPVVDDIGAWWESHSGSVGGWLIVIFVAIFILFLVYLVVVKGKVGRQAGSIRAGA